MRHFRTAGDGNKSAEGNEEISKSIHSYRKLRGENYRSLQSIDQNEGEVP